MFSAQRETASPSVCLNCNPGRACAMEGCSARLSRTADATAQGPGQIHRVDAPTANGGLAARAHRALIASSRVRESGSGTAPLRPSAATDSQSRACYAVFVPVVVHPLVSEG